MALYIIAGILVIVVVWLMALYNGLVRARNLVKDAWADIDTELKKRYDLVPSLVVTVQAYATHEKSTLEDVTQLRAQAMSMAGPTKAGTEDELTGAVKSVFAVAENYPELKASQNFLALQGQLTQVEDDIQSARAYYNAAVREYNTAISVVPKNIVAHLFGFAPSEYFQAAGQEKNAVAVAMTS